MTLQYNPFLIQYFLGQHRLELGSSTQQFKNLNTSICSGVFTSRTKFRVSPIPWILFTVVSKKINMLNQTKTTKTPGKLFHRQMKCITIAMFPLNIDWQSVYISPRIERPTQKEWWEDSVPHPEHSVSINSTQEIIISWQTHQMTHITLLVNKNF